MPDEPEVVEPQVPPPPPVESKLAELQKQAQKLPEQPELVESGRVHEDSQKAFAAEQAAGQAAVAKAENPEAVEPEEADEEEEPDEPAAV